MRQLKKFTITASLLFSFFLVSASASAQQISDKEIKKDITAIDNALSRLIKLEPKSYQYDVNRFSNLKFEKGNTIWFYCRRHSSDFS